MYAFFKTNMSMRNFCTAKATHIFLGKNGSVFAYSTLENIMAC